jgi:hypothetical protein
MSNFKVRGIVRLEEGDDPTVTTSDGRELFINFEGGDLTISDENRAAAKDGVVYHGKDVGWHIAVKGRE